MKISRKHIFPLTSWTNRSHRCRMSWLGGWKERQTAPPRHVKCACSPAMVVSIVLSASSSPPPARGKCESRFQSKNLAKLKNSALNFEMMHCFVSPYYLALIKIILSESRISAPNVQTTVEKARHNVRSDVWKERIHNLVNSAAIFVIENFIWEMRTTSTTTTNSTKISKSDK